MKKTTSGGAKKKAPPPPPPTITITFPLDTAAKLFEDPRALPALSMLHQVLGEHLTKLMKQKKES